MEDWNPTKRVLNNATNPTYKFLKTHKQGILSHDKFFFFNKNQEKKTESGGLYLKKFVRGNRNVDSTLKHRTCLTHDVNKGFKVEPSTAKATTTRTSCCFDSKWSTLRISLLMVYGTDWNTKNEFKKYIYFVIFQWLFSSFKDKLVILGLNDVIWKKNQSCLMNKFNIFFTYSSLSL